VTLVIATLWYLLVPPWRALETFDVNAPLSKWYEAAEFTTKQDCEHFRAEKLSKLLGASHETSRTAAAATLYEESCCVSSLDPRIIQ